MAVTPGATMSTSRTNRKRRPFRREQILEIAIQLFYEHGYQTTGMDDIGKAAGITGPGIYRHFKSKEDILLTALERGTEQVLGKVREIVEHSATPEETLRKLIGNFIKAVLNKPELASLMLKDGRLFPADIRAKWDLVHSLHMEEWTQALMQARQDLSDSESRLMVNGTFGLVTSAIGYHSGLGRPRLERLLNEMACSALLCDRQGRAAFPAERTQGTDVPEDGFR